MELVVYDIRSEVVFFQLSEEAHNGTTKLAFDLDISVSLHRSTNGMDIPVRAQTPASLFSVMPMFPRVTSLGVLYPSVVLKPVQTQIAITGALPLASQMQILETRLHHLNLVVDASVLANNRELHSLSLIDCGVSTMELWTASTTFRKLVVTRNNLLKSLDSVEKV